MAYTRTHLLLFTNLSPGHNLEGYAKYLKSRSIFSTVNIFFPFNISSEDYNSSQRPSHQPFLHSTAIYISSLSSSLEIILLKGPFFTIKLITSYNASAAAMVVCSALVSYAGATSTISQAMMLIPSRPRRIVRSSRVDHPPVSGVPVAGATIHSLATETQR